MNLEENERAEEWFLIIGDWVRATHKRWFYGFVAFLVIAIPLQMTLKLIFEGALIANLRQVQVNYTEVEKRPLEVLEKKIFDLGDGTYSGYIRLKNHNSEWGVPRLKYNFQYKTAGGSPLLGSDRMTFVLPFTEKIIVLPRFSPSSTPSILEFSIVESQFIRPPTLPVMNLEIQRRSLDLQVSQSVVSAVIVNRTPFKISEVELPVLLFDNKGQVIGANYTTINDLESNESRSFQYIWYNRINNVSRIEIIPELNQYNKDIFVDLPGTNPFDDRE